MADPDISRRSFTRLSGVPHTEQPCRGVDADIDGGRRRNGPIAVGGPHTRFECRQHRFGQEAAARTVDVLVAPTSSAG